MVIIIIIVAITITIIIVTVSIMITTTMIISPYPGYKCEDKTVALRAKWFSKVWCSSTVANSVAKYGDPWHDETRIKQTRPQ